MELFNQFHPLFSRRGRSVLNQQWKSYNNSVQNKLDCSEGEAEEEKVVRCPSPESLRGSPVTGGSPVNGDSWAEQRCVLLGDTSTRAIVRAVDI